uniref:Uncharacterized protein n=1 Tax=Arundo donax TaxID=35708 RepID=A0A0A9AEB0_ARUDO
MYRLLQVTAPIDSCTDYLLQEMHMLFQVIFLKAKELN